eukprot:2654352-Rhodomonas_salina.3
MTRLSAANGKNSDIAASAGRKDSDQISAPDEIGWAQKKRKRVTKSEHEPAQKRVRSSLPAEEEVQVAAAIGVTSDSNTKAKTKPHPRKTVTLVSAGETTPEKKATKARAKVKKEATLKEELSSKAMEVDTEALMTSEVNEKKKPKQKQKAKEEPVSSEAATIVPPDGWRKIYDLVVELRKERDAPVDWAGSEALGVDKSTNQIDKFHVLIALMLSSQTKDQVKRTPLALSLSSLSSLSLPFSPPSFIASTRVWPDADARAGATGGRRGGEQAQGARLVGAEHHRHAP